MASILGNIVKFQSAKYIEKAWRKLRLKCRFLDLIRQFLINYFYLEIYPQNFNGSIITCDGIVDALTGVTEWLLNIVQSNDLLFDISLEWREKAGGSLEDEMFFGLEFRSFYSTVYHWKKWICSRLRYGDEFDVVPSEEPENGRPWPAYPWVIDSPKSQPARVRGTKLFPKIEKASFSLLWSLTAQ